MTQLYLIRQDYMVVDPKDISRKSADNSSNLLTSSKCLFIMI